MLISHEAPMALEMGDADQYERESRNEIKRMLNEVMVTDVKVKDPHLQIVVRREESKKIAAAAAAVAENSAADTTTTSSSNVNHTGAATAATWGANRAARAKTTTTSDRSQVYKRRIRLTNVSDDITEQHLDAIFNTNDCVVSKIKISKDDATGKNRGFAFIEFLEESMVDDTLKRR
uniref:Eukaryotic translation initiation factor 3 subunit G n=1 Tax=Lygus hesperus TaxID=30085 RepID=A0A0A9Z175_LYGHE